MSLSHFNKKNKNIEMVDISKKIKTKRYAEAHSRLKIDRKLYLLLKNDRELQNNLYLTAKIAGVYAAKNIKAGTKIIYYKGKIITKKETERNPKYDNDKAIYLFNLNNRYDLDGDFKYNTARLINHSCEPNCEVDGMGLKLWIFALRSIKKGEELSYDYGFGFDKDYKQFPCKCDSKNCCGFIVREESRWRINKKFAMSNKKKLINNSK